MGLQHILIIEVDHKIAFNNKKAAYQRLPDMIWSFHWELDLHGILPLLQNPSCSHRLVPHWNNFAIGKFSLNNFEDGELFCWQE